MKKLALLLVLALTLTGMTVSALGEYAPGEYTAEAKGYGGYVNVVVTIGEDGTITDVKATGDKETPTVGGYAILDLPAEFVKAQSADVDAYAGATFTRNALVEAVQACLDQASAQ